MAATEVVGVIALGALAVWLLARSWRRWNDPLIDFGRELYTPWRLSQGAVLYRDVDDAYGPMSQHFNAALFQLAGTGLMTLVVANLAILGGIVAAAYALLRRAYGALAAWAACAVFLPVFAFADYLATANYNFITPYAHEATHGVLVCLLLVLALDRWRWRPSRTAAFGAGVLAGATLVLKSEFILAAVGVVATAAALRLRDRRNGAAAGTGFGGWMLAGCVLPTAAFTLWFARSVPWPEAWHYAAHAWLGAAQYAADPIQRGFLGFDHPGPNAWAAAGATVAALGLFAALGGAISLSLRAAHPVVRWAGVTVTAAGAVAIGIWFIPWAYAARGFVGVLLVYCVWHASRAAALHPGIVRGIRGPAADATTQLRMLLTVLALLLLARMVLNARLYQFGFYQAALAGMVIVAALLAEVPCWLPAVPGKRCAWTAVAVALLLPGVVRLTRASGQWSHLRSFPVSAGADRFYSLPAEVYPMATLVDLTATHLRQRPDNETVLVLPEGLMINYLARKRSPLSPFFFFSVATADDREAKLLEQLKQHPPQWVVLISRNLEEYGIHRYGEAPGQGQLLLNWVQLHYRRIGGGGGDPLDPRGCAVAVYKCLF